MHFLSIIEWWLSEWDEYHSNIVHYHHHHCRQQTTCDSFQYVQCSNVWSHPVLSACIYVLQSVRACVNMYGLIILSLNRCAHGVGALMDRDTPIRQPNINIQISFGRTKTKVHVGGMGWNYIRYTLHPYPTCMLMLSEQSTYMRLAASIRNHLWYKKGQAIDERERERLLRALIQCLSPDYQMYTEHSLGVSPKSIRFPSQRAHLLCVAQWHRSKILVRRPLRGPVADFASGSR